MIFAALALKLKEMIPWKWVLIGLVVIAVISGAWFAVHAYNDAISQVDSAKREVQETAQKLQTEQANVAHLESKLQDTTDFYAARDQRQAKAATRRSQVITRKEKVDEKGNIAADDPTLLDLNKLFPSGPDGTTGAAKNPAPKAAGMPIDAAGKVHTGG